MIPSKTSAVSLPSLDSCSLPPYLPLPNARSFRRPGLDILQRGLPSLQNGLQSASLQASMANILLLRIRMGPVWVELAGSSSA